MQHGGHVGVRVVMVLALLLVAGCPGGGGGGGGSDGGDGGGGNNNSTPNQNEGNGAAPNMNTAPTDNGTNANQSNENTNDNGTPPPPQNDNGTTAETPVADAGNDQVAAGGATVVLVGLGSSPSGTALTFEWTQEGGTNVTLEGEDTASATFTAPFVSGTLTFRLRVTDGGGATDIDDVRVIVTVPPVLFIANSLGNSITSYVDPGELNSDQPPATFLTGLDTELSTPSDVVVAGDGALIVSNAASDSLTVYADAAAASGVLEPIRSVSGPVTGLDGPTSLAITPSGDRLFVSNVTTGADTIVVYTDPSAATFAGDRPPDRTIDDPALDDPNGLFFTPNGDLYVANSGTSSILVFGQADDLDVPATVTRTISVAITPPPVVDSVVDVFVDEDDHLFVVDAFGRRVFVFNNASTLDGARAPLFTLTVPSTSAVQLAGLAVDRDDTGFLLDSSANAIYVYFNISTRTGEFPPDATITGPATRLNGPMRLYLWQR